MTSSVRSPGKGQLNRAHAYKAAMDYLQRVAAGKVMLVAPSAAPPVPGVGEVAFFVGNKVMGREVGGGSCGDDEPHRFWG